MLLREVARVWLCRAGQCMRCWLRAAEGLGSGGGAEEAVVVAEGVVVLRRLDV